MSKGKAVHLLMGDTACCGVARLQIKQNSPKWQGRLTLKLDEVTCPNCLAYLGWMRAQAQREKEGV